MQQKTTISLSQLRERWAVSLFIFFSVAIALFDFLGLLNSVPIISERIPSLILLLLSLLTGYVVFTRPDNDNKRHNELTRRVAQINETVEMIDSLKEVRVRRFKDAEDCVKYINRRIGQAKTKVLGSHWDVRLNFAEKIAQNMLHREIFIIDESNQQEYSQRLNRRLNSSGPTYSCAFFRTLSDTSLQFIIIDSHEIIFLSRFAAHNLAIRHLEIVNLFEHHHNEMWDKATKLKENDKIYDDKIESALAIFMPTEPFPANLEKCVQACLEKHRQLTNHHTNTLS